MNTSAETNIKLDLFQYYIREVADLLSPDDFTSSSSMTSGSIGAANGNFGSLFCNIAGDGLSDFKKTRLNRMLRQSVVTLKQEVDEMLDPVISMHRLRGLMAPTKSCVIYHDAKCKNETENCAQKRLKIPSYSPAINNPLNASPVSCTLSAEGSPNERKYVAMPNKLLTGCYNKVCDKFSTENPNPSESKPSRVDYLKQANDSPHNKDTNESFLGSSSKDDKEHGEVNDDLRILLVNKGPMVEEKMEKHAAELSATLGLMEERIEELLDIVISSCRPMTLAEKHQLRGKIQNLHPKNRDRVVEIIQRKRPSEKRSSCDITVDLQHEDDLTLWRIYFYVTAAENGRKR